MQYYHLSYDLMNVEGDENDVALKSLIALIQKQLGGDVLNRPVRSTLIFSSALGFDSVRSLIFTWSKEANSYYVVSEIANPTNGGVQCRLVANENLEKGLERVKKELTVAEKP